MLASQINSYMKRKMFQLMKVFPSTVVNGQTENLHKCHVHEFHYCLKLHRVLPHFFHIFSIDSDYPEACCL